jgi:hypothetical protein
VQNIGSASSALRADASITVDTGVVLTGSTITLEAQSTSTSTITSASTDTGAGIYTENSAQITINGHLNATGALSVLTNVNLTDHVNATTGSDLAAITVVGTNTSTVTLGAAAQVSGSSVDIGATTTINSTINAADLADSFLNSAQTIVPSSATGTLVELQTDMTNTTEVVVPATAQVTAGTGVVGGGTTGPSLVLAATDSTNVTSDFTPAQTLYLPLLNGVLLFSAVDSSVALDRTTEVLVGDMSTTMPTISSTATINSAGDASITATSGGRIVNDELSDVNLGSSVGSAETYGEGFTFNGATQVNAGTAGDTTLVELRGVKIDGPNDGGLAVSATSDTNYLASAHYVTNTVYGVTNALIDYSNVTAGPDGLSLESQDTSALTAIAQSLDINSQHIIGIDTFTVTVSATSAVNTLDKDVSAKLTNSTVNSSGEVTLQALDNETIIALADTQTVAITTTPLDKGYFSFGGTFAANSILGQVIASIQASTVTTSTVDTGSATAGDVQVLAGNTSIIDAEAQAGTTATGGSIAAGGAAAVAINTIGWSGTTGLAVIGTDTGTVNSTTHSTGLDVLEAAVNALLGTSFWTHETPSNVTASVTGSTIHASDALLVMAVAQGVVNSTVSNVSSVTGSAVGGTKTGAAGGLIATNKVSGAAQAFIDNTSTPSATVSSTGALTVDAENNDTIASNSTLITNADATTDGAAGLAKLAVDKIINVAGTAQYTSGGGTVQLNFGDLVQFVATYDTSRSLFSINPVKDVTLHTGDTVHVSKGYDPQLGTIDQTYVYIGTATVNNFNLEDANYLETANWALGAGSNGGVYQFKGASGTYVNLGTGTPLTAAPGSGVPVTMDAPGYTNLNYWYLEPYSQLLPSGYNIKSATGVAVGGIVVVNDVHGGATAYVASTTISGAGSVAVTATDDATITATTDATASASGGTVFGGQGSGSALAVGSTITTNQVVGNADAHVVDSSVTTATGDISVTATNTDTIAATTESSVTVGGNGSGSAIGVVMAFNTIGAEVNNLLSLGVDALVGQNVLGSNNPATTTAYIQDSNIHSGGALTVQATSTETVTSTVGNNTTADAVGFANANGFTVGITLGMNEIHAAVTAFIDNDNSTGNRPANATVQSAGAMSVSATDSSSDTASSDQTSTNTPLNDSAGGLINHYADLALNSYQYTDKSGTQNLNYGDKVWVDDGTGNGTGSVYEYMGPGRHHE